MTNRRKVKRFRTIQAKNSRERMKAEKDRIVRLSKNFLYYDPYTCMFFYGHIPVGKKIEVLKASYEILKYQFWKYKKKVQKEFGGS